MGVKALKLSASNLYDQDFLGWTRETARLLRAGRYRELDVEHAAEEIEDLGKAQFNTVDSRLTVLLMHLLKWKHQPQKRSRSWQSTIATQRLKLRRLFRQSPSLRAAMPKSLEEVYSDAVTLAAIQTGLPEKVFPAGCPFSTEQIMDREFLPQ